MHDCSTYHDRLIGIFICAQRFARSGETRLLYILKTLVVLCAGGQKGWMSGVGSQPRIAPPLRYIKYQLSNESLNYRTGCVIPTVTCCSPSGAKPSLWSAMQSNMHLENHASNGGARLHGACRREPPKSLSSIAIRRLSRCGGITPNCTAGRLRVRRRQHVAGASRTSVHRSPTWGRDRCTE